ncbi:hypothetical protein V5O48_011544 [Marasmius crinis-equi]|uniref:F-box domain-containing protein n=1 Tax=Marasmius crinis-equi TaxID=585013 RepID=A0ABR3F5B8_9AGAR
MCFPVFSLPTGLDPRFALTSSVQQQISLSDEVLVEIFQQLVESTGSSASLLPCVYTCVRFRNILVGESKLWTRLRADFDTINFPTHIDLRDYVALWPSLYDMLHLSRDQPIRFSLDLVPKSASHLAQFPRISPAHLHTLVATLLKGADAYKRCEELVICVQDWEHLIDIMLPLAHTLDEFPALQRVEFRYFRRLGEATTYRDLETLPTPLNASGSISKDEIEVYGHGYLPALKEVVLDGIGFGWDTFCATGLTSLHLLNVPGSLFQPAHNEMKDLLKLSSETLTTLELGDWALPRVATLNLVQYDLPALAHLRVSIHNYFDFLGLVTAMRLPNLKRLELTDDVHRARYIERTFDSNYMAVQEADGLRRMCLEAYSVMTRNWPLHQVTELVMSHAIFYETDSNRVSLLESSYQRPETWEPHGIPIASQFFSCFSSLVSLQLPDADATTRMAVEIPPRRWNVSTSRFDDVLMFFPSLARP